MNCERVGLTFLTAILIGLPSSQTFSELKTQPAASFSITGISVTPQGVRLEIEYPESFTDRLNVFYTPTLREPDWQRIAGPLETSGNSSISWTRVPEEGQVAKTGFYGLGNYDLDSDGDGIPDWWELEHFGGATNATADEDVDGDGLTNYWEYRLGSDPHFAFSLDPYNILNDGDYDSTGDGLSNREEIQIWNTDPAKWDTADNGFSDGALVAQGHDPLDPTAIPAYDWFAVTGNMGQDVVKTRTRTWTIPPGEARRFEIFLYSEEFPEYTAIPSEFNDVLTWNLGSSLGGGSSGSVNVNSRHLQWLQARRQGRAMHGLTPVHPEESTVIAAPDDQPVTVDLELSAVNINDGILPSTVIAHISTVPDTAGETEHPDPAYAETRDPINVINGNVTLTERDLFIPAPGLPLIFERHYHSRSNDADLSIGGGWRHTYDRRLISRPNETYPKFPCKAGQNIFFEVFLSTNEKNAKQRK